MFLKHLTVALSVMPKTLAKLEETSTNAINVKKNGVLEKTVSLKI